MTKEKTVEYIIKYDGVIQIKEFVCSTDEIVGFDPTMVLSPPEIANDIIKNRLDQETKEYFRTASKADLALQHFQFGMWIRNSYALWSGADENVAGDSDKHPDNLSGEIMDKVVATLQSAAFDEAMQNVGEA